MDLLKKDRIYTVEDIYALPEGSARSWSRAGFIIWCRQVGHIRKSVAGCIRKYLTLSIVMVGRVRFITRRLQSF